MKKSVLLQLLKNKFPSVDQKELYARIVCGEVVINGEHIRDPQYKVPVNAQIQFSTRKYVSRGGLKLEAAIKEWQLPVKGRVFLDAGASTGGFTDCLLQHGAQQVHAIDVGYNQIDFTLRQDSRVILAERTNIMRVEKLDPQADAAVADLSFRSLRGAANHILNLVAEKWMVGLLKPQFEAESDHITDFDGVVRVEEEAQRILDKTIQSLIEDGVKVRAVMTSPIKGRKGNREFLLLLTGSTCNIFSGERFTYKNSLT